MSDPLRCLVTGTPCGTDTRMIGSTCQCQVCAAHEQLSAQSAEIARLRAALGEIVKFDRAEKRTCVDFDPAGCTYEVEDIDGPHAARARAALEQ